MRSRDEALTDIAVGEAAQAVIVTPSRSRLAFVGIVDNRQRFQITGIGLEGDLLISDR